MHSGWEYISTEPNTPPPPDAPVGSRWSNHEGEWQLLADGKWHRVGYSRYISEHDTWEPSDG